MWALPRIYHGVTEFVTMIVDYDNKRVRELVYGKNTGKILNFLASPSSFSVLKKFNFEQFPRYGQSHPLVVFQSSGATTIDLKVQFHNDLGDSFVPSLLFEFLDEYNSIESETRSIPIVRFSVGPIQYDCYIQRFHPKIVLTSHGGQPIAVDVEFVLIVAENDYPFGGGLLDPESGYDFGQTPPPLQAGVQVASVGALSGLLRLALPQMGAPVIAPIPKDIQELKEEMKKYTPERMDTQTTPQSLGSHGTESVSNSLGNTSTQSPIIPVNPSDSKVEQRLPKSNGRWLGERGNSPWQSDLAPVNKVTHSKPIPFHNGYPDFGDWSQKDYQFDNLCGNNDKDFALADKRLAQEMGLKNQTAAEDYRYDNDFTWHHHEDGKTLQLVPKNVHKNIPHEGGASQLREAPQLRMD